MKDAEIHEYFQAFLSTGDMLYINSTYKHKAYNMLLRISSCVISILKKWFMIVKYNKKFNNRYKVSKIFINDSI